MGRWRWIMHKRCKAIWCLLKWGLSCIFCLLYLFSTPPPSLSLSFEWRMAVFIRHPCTKHSRNHPSTVSAKWELSLRFKYWPCKSETSMPTQARSATGKNASWLYYRWPTQPLAQACQSHCWKRGFLADTRTVRINKQSTESRTVLSKPEISRKREKKIQRRYA